VTAAIQAGGGTLGGTSTVLTNSSGIAAFTNLSITGADGSRTLQFSAPALAAATSSSILVTQASTGNIGSNEPSGFSVVAERAFSSLVESGWINDNGGASIVADATGPKSPGSLLRFTYPSGFQAGFSPASQYRTLPTGRAKVYGAIWVRWSPNWQGEASGTNKVLYNWIHDNPSVFLSAGGSGSGTLTPTIRLQNTPDSREYLFPNVVSNAHVVRGQWHRWEYVLIANTPGSSN